MASATARYINSLLWSATDIVMVTEGDTVDDKFEVVEVWRGKMEKGTELRIPRLSAPSDDPRIPGLALTRLPHLPRGGKMIFLLRKGTPGAPWDVRSSANTWYVAGKFFEASIVCDRNGGVSTFLPEEPQDQSGWAVQRPVHDWRTRHPVARREWTTLSYFRMQVAACNRVRKPLTEIENIPEPDLRAARIVPYLTWTGEANDTPLMQREAFRVLTGCGAPAIPQLRALLRDGTCKVSSQENIVGVMATNQPKAIGPVFVDMLREDLEFWKAIEEAQDRDHPLGNRYQTGRILIRSLAVMGFQESRETIQRTLEFWQARPDLEKAAPSRSTMTSYCEAALKALDARGHKRRIGNDVRAVLGLPRRIMRRKR
jgi:hypothetical protein